MVDGKWAYGNMIEYGKECHIFEKEKAEKDSNPLAHMPLVHRETVGQFCGHDSNDDIDIYEKDIIQVWRHGQLMRTFLVSDIRTFLNEYKNDEHGAIWKIAGNLIDNPELLEGK